MTDKMRVRVRPYVDVPEQERRQVFSNQEALSIPHIGEAVDKASDMYRARGGLTRAVHFGHAIGTKCDTAQPDDRGRCLLIDYVPQDQPKLEGELDSSVLATQKG